MYSNEHINYLRKLRINKWIVFSVRWLILVLFIFLWQISADKEWINSFITSSPKEIVDTFVSLYRSNDLFYNIWITTYETLFSFLLGSILGILIASLLWCNKTLYKILDPFLTVLNSLPKVALGPIIIIWVGANTNSIVLMALLISVINTIISVHTSFKNTNDSMIKLMRSLKATKIQIYFKLLLPSNVTNIVSALKINMSMSLIGIIMGEFLVSKAGIGYLIIYGSQVFNLNLIMTGIVILAFLAAILYYLISFIEKKLTK